MCVHSQLCATINNSIVYIALKTRTLHPRLISVPIIEGVCNTELGLYVTVTLAGHASEQAEYSDERSHHFCHRIATPKLVIRCSIRNKFTFYIVQININNLVCYLRYAITQDQIKMFPSINIAPNKAVIINRK